MSKCKRIKVYVYIFFIPIYLCVITDLAVLWIGNNILYKSYWEYRLPFFFLCVYEYVGAYKEIGDHY